ncbi:MAG: hypothetical protein Kow00127_18220 [Bacteroidales bacterium]
MTRFLKWLLPVLLLLASFASNGQNEGEGDYSSFVPGSSTGMELFEAIKENDSVQAERLIRSLSDINEKIMGYTSLHWAAFFGKLGIVEMLLDAGANVDEKSYFGVTPLWIAAYKGYVYIADTLIQNGAEINTTSPSGQTPLMLAAAFNDTLMTDMLLYYGADPDLRDESGNSALNYAATFDYNQILSLLLSYGANPDLPENEGYTPLIVAIQNGNYEGAELLLQAGASVDKPTMEGFLPIHFAVRWNDPDMHKLLERYGFDVCSESEIKPSPEGMAAHYGGKEVRRMVDCPGGPVAEPGGYDCTLLSVQNGREWMMGIEGGITFVPVLVRWSAGYNFRPAARSILVKVAEHSFYQYWSYRHWIYSGIEKQFLLANTPNWSLRVVAGAEAGITLTDWRGTKLAPPLRFKLAPEAGLKIGLRSYSIDLRYRYLDFKESGISPHQIILGIGFNWINKKFRPGLKKAPYNFPV